MGSYEPEAIMKSHPSILPLVVLLTVGAAGAVAAQDFDVLLPGVLTQDSTGACDVLYSPLTKAYYMLDNLGGFVLGDTVVVTAAFEGESFCDTELYSYLHDNTIASWRGYDFGCGYLLFDPEYGCGVLDSERFGPLSIGSPPGFRNGQFVRAIGTMQLYPYLAIPECFAYYGLFDITLSACADTSTATQSLSWSRLKARFH
jgi:hypothetical protein